MTEWTCEPSNIVGFPARHRLELNPVFEIEIYAAGKKAPRYAIRVWHKTRLVSREALRDPSVGIAWRRPAGSIYWEKKARDIPIEEAKALAVEYASERIREGIEPALEALAVLAAVAMPKEES